MKYEYMKQETGFPNCYFFKISKDFQTKTHVKAHNMKAAILDLISVCLYFLKSSD